MLDGAEEHPDTGPFPEFLPDFARERLAGGFPVLDMPPRQKGIFGTLRMAEQDFPPRHDHPARQDLDLSHSGAFYSALPALLS